MQLRQPDLSSRNDPHPNPRPQAGTRIRERGFGDHVNRANYILSLPNGLIQNLSAGLARSVRSLRPASGYPAVEMTRKSGRDDTSRCPLCGPGAASGAPTRREPPARDGGRFYLLSLSRARRAADQGRGFYTEPIKVGMTVGRPTPARNCLLEQKLVPRAGFEPA